ncbi:MAG: tripartite tricarboxylate transporter substrate binding protein [Pigmentiphaga sp.]|nr:tripartite tricarboxylate transporter substrate binding protein [Pigmentiphaga sp.]
MSTTVLTRSITAFGLGLALAIGGGAAGAQTYPTKDIQFIVPMAPGGGVDTVSRTVAQMLAERVGQPIIVENRPGAGGLIAAGYVARANPDGYTVFVADSGQLSVNPTLYKDLPYDRSKPFVPITEAVSTPLFLAVNADLPIHSVPEFLEYARAHPGMPYGSVGVGSVHHLGMQMLVTQAGLDMVHVPYKGSSQTTTALIGGEVGVILSALPSLKGHIESGRVRVIGVATPERTELMPDLPTIAEGGLPGYNALVNIGFVLPPETSGEIAQFLHQEIKGLLEQPEFQQRLKTMGLIPLASSPQEYAAKIAADTAKYKQVIESANIASN